MRDFLRCAVLGSAAMAVAVCCGTCNTQNLMRVCVAQGLADTFLLLGMPFDSSEAAQLNKEIFECIYFAGEQLLLWAAQLQPHELPIHDRYACVVKGR